ncbi:uncharacterized protein LOC109860708 [Pseudomyrmex gracilis]|uniref:uncharacterized protein LOC109860708 n=1 Tax=Pseudomyrmex gracilis TaxID=219809 RepID=UPI0009956E76|nr:uncharacterized protein LOC109860708 [Pseudomyrmex gracilis]
MFYLLRYLSLFINTDKFKNCFEQVRMNLDSLKDDEEFQIFHRHAVIGKFGTIFSMIFVYTSLAIFTLTFFSPHILDIVIPLNESRERWHFPDSLEYFIDQEKHLYLLAGYLFLVALVGMNTALATETASMAYVQHICAMFSITSYRIERIVNRNQMRLKDSLRKFENYADIAEIVDSHQRAIKCVHMCNSILGICFLLIIIVGVISLSVNLFRFCNNIMTSSDNLTVASMLFLYILSHFVFMFLGNYFGQEVINYSDDVFKKIWSTRWYATPLQMQKCLLVIMHRSMKSSTLVIGCMFILSLEGLATLISTSLSYFMMIYSVRQT